jgi:hypothetical protein
MTPLHAYLLVASSTLSAVASLFFVRFWRTTAGIVGKNRAGRT